MIEVIKSIPDMQRLPLEPELTPNHNEVGLTQLQVGARFTLQQVFAEPVGHRFRIEDVTPSELTPARYGPAYHDCRLHQVLARSRYVLLGYEGDEALIPTGSFSVETDSGLVYPSYFTAHRIGSSGLAHWMRNIFYRKL